MEHATSATRVARLRSRLADMCEENSDKNRGVDVALMLAEELSVRRPVRINSARGPRYHRVQRRTSDSDTHHTLITFIAGTNAINFSSKVVTVKQWELGTSPLEILKIVEFLKRLE